MVSACPEIPSVMSLPHAVRLELCNPYALPLIQASPSAVSHPVCLLVFQYVSPRSHFYPLLVALRPTIILQCPRRRLRQDTLMCLTFAGIQFTIFIASVCLMPLIARILIVIIEKPMHTVINDHFVHLFHFHIIVGVPQG